MKELLDSFIQLEKRLSQQKGDFRLFALFLREDAQDKWDLVVAAPWADDDIREALSYIAKEVQDVLSPDDLTKVSRIVIIDESNPALQAINNAIGVEHGLTEVKESFFFGLLIKHAYVITSKKLLAAVETPAGA
jgi:hypothetical protein